MLLLVKGYGDVTLLRMNVLWNVLWAGCKHRDTIGVIVWSPALNLNLIPNTLLVAMVTPLPLSIASSMSVCNRARCLPCPLHGGAPVGALDESYMDESCTLAHALPRGRARSLADLYTHLANTPWRPGSKLSSESNGPMTHQCDRGHKRAPVGIRTDPLPHQYDSLTAWLTHCRHC